MDKPKLNNTAMPFQAPRHTRAESQNNPPRPRRFIENLTGSRRTGSTGGSSVKEAEIISTQSSKRRTGDDMSPSASPTHYNIYPAGGSRTTTAGQKKNEL